MSSRAAGRMRVAAIVLGVANGSSHLRAQGPALARSNATLTDRFSMVAAVRELSDGRVIVADWRENKISICSFKAMFCDALTRTGDGPGEYRRFGNLFPLAGDSTVISADGRWNVFYKDHFVAQQRFPSEGVWGVDIAGVDRTGRVLQIAPTHYLSHQGRGISEPQEADALAVVRRRRTPQASLYFLGKEADTVATLRGTRGEVRAATSGTFHGAAIHYRLINPLSAQQQALMFPDGWIAIALDEPYRVDWITPDGRRLRGAPLPFAMRALDDSQKRFAVENSGKAKAFPNAADYPSWPSLLPPFLGRALIASPDGSLVIRRTRDAVEPTVVRYDVVDRAGRLARQFVVKSNERVVGFGATSVYVIAKDSDDLEEVRRHPWP